MGEVRLRPERSTDLVGVLALQRAAFSDRGTVVADLVADLEAGPPPVLGVVAEDGDAIVGHVLTTRCLIDAHERLVEALVLSPLAVRADRRRAGIGRRLVEAAVDAAERASAPMVLLEGDPAYYAPLGFVPAAGLGLRRPSLRIPAAGFQARPLSAWEPWMTGTMVYPDVWWRHDVVGLRGGG